jgi:hypothetical protein
MSIVFAAIVTCVIFISGAVTGVIGLVSLAVHREERNHTLTGQPPGYMARAARRLNGVHVRIPGPRETSPAGGKWAPEDGWQFPVAAASHSSRRSPPAPADLASSAAAPAMQPTDLDNLSRRSTEPLTI